MTTITVAEGDELDAILIAAYGDRSIEALGVVLAANPGLAAAGNRPPAGARVRLPDLPAGAGRTDLW